MSDRQGVTPMPNPTPILVRTLTSDDIVLVRAWLKMFGTAFDEQETYASAQPDDAYLQRLLDSDGFIALAALCENAVVGGLAAYELKKFEQARSEIYIYDLAVNADYRRQGIATQLISELRTIAQARRAYVIFVQADLTDDAAIALYSRLGVREDVLHFDIPVN